MGAAGVMPHSITSKAGAKTSMYKVGPIIEECGLSKYTRSSSVENRTSIPVNGFQRTRGWVGLGYDQQDNLYGAFRRLVRIDERGVGHFL